MNFIRKLGSTSNTFRVRLRRSDTGQGYTGLVFGSTGLSISTICDNEASPVTYTSAGSTIETITTLATYAAPTATKCRFKEVDATGNAGLYELQFADARFAVSGAKILRMTISGVATLMDKDVTVQLSAIDIDDAVAAGITRIDATVSSRSTLTAAGVWDALVAGITTASSIGKRIIDYLTGDSFTRIGAAGVGLTNLGDARLENLDASVGSVGGSVTTLTMAVASLANGQAQSFNAIDIKLGTPLVSIAADIAAIAASGGGSGDGDIPVNHDYGGTDTYRVLDSDDLPVDNAVIRAYVQADYDAGDIDRVPPTVYTGSDGRWISNLMLDPDTYILAIYNPATASVTMFRDIEVTV